MSKNLETLVLEALAVAQQKGTLPAFDCAEAYLERPADVQNGDYSSTIAMRTAKLAHKAPRAIAEAIVAELPKTPMISKVEIAGPGFINFYLSVAAAHEVVNEIRDKGMDFGRQTLETPKRVQVEFISANPVGPLHIGHGRWAALGDSLARVLKHAGYTVNSEYYINDHGSQMDVFGSSVAERYLQLLELTDQGMSLAEAKEALLSDRARFVEDEEDAHPESHPYMDAFNEHLGGNAYGGDYIIDVAANFVESDGNRLKTLPADERISQMRERGYKMMLKSIEQTCERVRCHMDTWSSERALYEGNPSKVDSYIQKLRDKGLVYDDETGAVWFKSSTFGDDKDRVLIKSNGDYTYFASDVAYHNEKFERDDHVIDIWGADHHGYIARVNAALAAFGRDSEFEVLLGQLVNLLRGGKPVRMSKRKGTMIELNELIDMVGVDATRYILVSKSANQMIDFDIEAATKRDSSNPVYYVQYAHARICSLLCRAADADKSAQTLESLDDVAQKAIGVTPNLGLLSHPQELALSRKLSEFPGLIRSCAQDRTPFRLTHFAEDLAAAYHAFYTACQILPHEGSDLDPELSRARLALCDATRKVLALTLYLIGVDAPISM